MYSWPLDRNRTRIRQGWIGQSDKISESGDRAKRWTEHRIGQSCQRSGSSSIRADTHPISCIFHPSISLRGRQKMNVSNRGTIFPYHCGNARCWHNNTYVLRTNTHKTHYVSTLIQNVCWTKTMISCCGWLFRSCICLCYLRDHRFFEGEFSKTVKEPLPYIYIYTCMYIYIYI